MYGPYSITYILTYMFWAEISSLVVRWVVEFLTRGYKIQQFT